MKKPPKALMQTAPLARCKIQFSQENTGDVPCVFWQACRHAVVQTMVQAIPVNGDGVC